MPLTTLTRLTVAHEIDETLNAIVAKAKHVDHFSAKDQELKLNAMLQDRWSSHVQKALAELRHTGLGTFTGYSWKPTPDEVINILRRNLSGDNLTNGLDTAPEIAAAFNTGRASTSAQFTKQTGRKPVRKDFTGVGFGEVFGITEDQALAAIDEQLIVSAGGFFDQQLSDSIKSDLNDLFQGTLTRDEFVAQIETLVNSRLVGRSLPTSYFDNLTTHYVVRSRNIGSLYRASSLGAEYYTLVNPRDNRTSPVCEKLADGSTLYRVADASSVAGSLLSARTMSDLKTAQPFLSNPDNVQPGPIPPLHFPKCRTAMNYQFKGL